MIRHIHVGSFLFAIACSSPSVHACLNGLGPNWEDIAARQSTPNVEVLELLKDRGEMKGDEVERWYEDDAGRVVYCRGNKETWHSILFEQRGGKWRQINAVTTTID